jgi:short-subunit dehydrogenase
MTVNKHNPSIIVITGASSGIGEGLALHYAAEGKVLALTGRDQKRLQSIAARCEAKGAKVLFAVLDVADQKEMKIWLEAFDDRHPVDLVIANAGISAGTGGVLKGEPPEQVRKVFDINLYGVLNTIEPLLPRMIERGRGQIAIMSSLAGYRGWPGAPAYCGSKAAVKVYGESLRGAVAKTGVKVNVICPGFVKSRITDVNDFSMPFIMDTEKAAAIIARALQRNKGRIAFPKRVSFFAWFISVLPDFMAQSILCAAPTKPAEKK